VQYTDFVEEGRRLAQELRVSSVAACVAACDMLRGMRPSMLHKLCGGRVTAGLGAEGQAALWSALLLDAVNMISILCFTSGHTKCQTLTKLQSDADKPSCTRCPATHALVVMHNDAATSLCRHLVRSWC
jgi:hypothetical protein